MTKIENRKSKIENPFLAFLDLIKFSHTIFAMPFALIATFWASRAVSEESSAWPGISKLSLIILCMILARTFAMTFNRYIDRHIDSANPRTAARPSVIGTISPRFMIFTLIICILLFLAAAAVFNFLHQNPWPLVLAPLAIIWLAAYSFTKRFTILCHFWLGISLGLAPLGAWIAIAPPAASLFDPLLLTILLFGLGVTFWVAGFDILYALQDEHVDRTQNLHSIPAALGRRRALLISRFCHVLTIVVFLTVGIVGNFHLLYFLGLTVAAITLLIEQLLVSENDISKINTAFMTANALIGLTFGTLAIADTLI